jgi:predicted PurR-regulated permease PerM
MEPMDSRQRRAAVLIIILGAALILALSSFATGLLSAPVLFVIFAPVYRRLRRRLRAGISAGLTLGLALLLILLPGLWLLTLILGQAQDVLASLLSSEVLARLDTLRIGRFAIGPELVKLGQDVIGALGRGAFRAVGSVTLGMLNFTVAFFGLYYMLVTEGSAWHVVRPYIPFSAGSAEKLRERFEAVTISTVVGTGVTALVQGALVGVAFAITGLPNAAFWAVVTAVFSILPVVGSGLVWGPGAAALALQGHTGQAVFMVLWGLLLVGNVDNVIRPAVFRRWAQIHPLITVIGAFAGIRYLGLLGILIGPLALSYFFELVRLYNEEYVNLSGDLPDPVSRVT